MPLTWPEAIRDPETIISLVLGACAETGGGGGGGGGGGAGGAMPVGVVA